jgi:hypothetical protein
MYKHIYYKNDGSKLVITCSADSNTTNFDATLREVIYQNTYSDKTHYQVLASSILAWEIINADS